MSSAKIEGPPAGIVAVLIFAMIGVGTVIAGFAVAILAVFRGLS